MLKAFILIVFNLFQIFTLFGENKFPKKIFRSPIDYEMVLSGNFGELRNNHFHSGIDIKTGGIIGKKIFAVADGYICRIKVSSNGFGKALYIRHRNGYTSVYSHLNQFNKEINIWVKSQQYAKRSFEIELYPDADQFIIKKGEIIAYSGNSGGSDGPHLHFEIRETDTEKPLNPLLFDFEVKDNIPPKITGIKIYPFDSNSKINNGTTPCEFSVEETKNSYHLKNKEPILVSGNVGFAIRTYDLLNENFRKNGVYSIELIIDSTLIYSHKLDEFAFSESKYINSFIDYAHYIDNEIRYQKSFLDEGNQLSIYEKVVNGGKCFFNDTLLHTLQYKINDVYGNTSYLSCELKSTLHDEILNETVLDNKNQFHFEKENKYSNESIELIFPPFTFYTSLSFECSIEKSEENFYSDIFYIHHKQVPIHYSFKAKLKTDKIPVNYFHKALVVNLNNDEISPENGVYKDGFIETSLKELGKYAIMIDTVAPKIVALNIHQGKKINNYERIVFKVTDELSGIQSYEGKLNGEWILMEFDPKSDRIFYNIDEHMKKGKNTVLLIVNDNRNNSTSFEAEVFY